VVALMMSSQQSVRLPIFETAPKAANLAPNNEPSRQDRATDALRHLAAAGAMLS
jgi:hypothetical protein